MTYAGEGPDVSVWTVAHSRYSVPNLMLKWYPSELESPFLDLVCFDFGL